MNKRILFVDDEPRVLQGLERMLRGMRCEWEMRFAPGGKDALEILERMDFDVIVTDMKMPGVDGSQLLGEVMYRYPGMVRIILSGHTDKEIILKSVRTAHQYLSKPCDSETIKNTILQTCKLQDMLKSEALREIVSKMESLPSLPSVYTDMVEEMNASEPSIKKIGDIIGKDLGMTAKVLQMVNSAFFGLPRQITVPSQAVAMLGLEIIKSLVLSIHIFSQFNQSLVRHFSLDAIWEHSMRVSKCSRRILELEHCEKTQIDNALLAGMMHDVGKLILAVNMPDRYDQVNRLVFEEKALLHEAEKDVFSASHAEVGAYLLGLWGLPFPVIEALGFHHDLSGITQMKLSPVIAVHYGNYLEHELNPKSGVDHASLLDSGKLENLGFKEKMQVWRDECVKLITEADRGA